MAQQDPEMKKGFIAIIKDGFKMISANRKMFIQVTATLMLIAWCLCFACWITLSRLLSLLYDGIVTEWAILTVLGISIMLYHIVLSSCSVVFAFASVYSSPNCSKDMTSRKVIMEAAAGARIIFRDLVHTFAYMFLGFAIYSLLLIMGIHCGMLMSKRMKLESGYNYIYMILHDTGVGFIGTTCQVASAVTILEGVGGIEAVKRSLVLIKRYSYLMISGNTKNMPIFGEVWVVVCYLAYLFFDTGMLVQVENWPGDTRVRIAIQGFCHLLFFMLVFLNLVMSTCLYSVCKEYNLEMVHKSVLTTLLDDAYLEQEHLSSGEELTSPV